jgi:hypothetical protein
MGVVQGEEGGREVRKKLGERCGMILRLKYGQRT